MDKLGSGILHDAARLACGGFGQSAAAEMSNLKPRAEFLVTTFPISPVDITAQATVGAAAIGGNDEALTERLRQFNLDPAEMRPHFAELGVRVVEVCSTPPATRVRSRRDPLCIKI